MHTRSMTRTRRVAVILAVLSPLLTSACTDAPADPPEDVATAAAPAGKVAAVCDNTRPGPATAPAGSVAVDPDIDADLADKTKANSAGTTFWLAPGRHMLGDDRYSQVAPKEGNTYLGAPGAILDGGKTNQYAFVGAAGHVTIRYLTVTGFVPPNNQGVVNHDSGDDWVIEHNTIQHNAGAGMMAGVRQQVRGNCLRENGQYGMNAFKAGNTISGLVVEGNEVVGNNTDDWETTVPGCGCTGGIKFWAVNGADIRGNWVHDNRGPGLWADTNNNDFLVEGNLVEDNDSAAILYETSYNAVIRDNTIRRNNWVAGKRFAGRGDNFPAATIYLSESGGEPRIPARTDKIEVSGNVLKDNWSGITLWENADRFCNSPANTSDGTCTPLVPDKTRCSQPGIAAEPLYDDCRWKTKRVHIHDNRFAVEPAVVGCESLCTRMAVLSNFGTYPDWSPYMGDVIKEAITSGQDNRFYDNVYSGPWTFMPHDTSRLLEVAEWQAEPYRQDEGSTFIHGGGS